MCKKSLLMMLLLALLVPWAAKAQTTVTIGDGTAGSNRVPIDTYYNYSISEQLYTADEIGMAGTITSISFNYINTVAKDFPIEVYMKNVDAADLSTAGISLADADLVFEGTLSVTDAGWYNIDLDTPFAYDGRSNLLIGVNKGYVYWFSNNSWQCTATDVTMARYSENDNNAYETSTTPSTASANRPNIQMEITAGSGPTCDRPESLVVSDITGYGATCTWESSVGNYTFEYKKAADSEWTVVTGLTANTYTLSNLEQMTAYNTRVKAVCGAGLESGYRTANFTTLEVCPDGMVCIGTGTATSSSVPVTTCYNYSLSQQIYTAAEIGGAGAFLSIDFYSTNGAQKARNFNIYMVSTDKSSFESNTDWIAVTAADLVYSATNYTWQTGWNSFELDVPFVYNGTSNVAIVIDDEKVTDYECSTTFRVFTTEKDQALYYQSDYTNLDPTTSLTTSGSIMSQKNCIRIAIGEPPACPKPTGLMVKYEGGTEAIVAWTSDATAWNMRVNGTPINGTITNPYTLTGLELSTTYEVEVQANCGDATSDWAGPVSFTTDACMPEDQCALTFVVTDSYGDGWNGASIDIYDYTGNELGDLLATVTNENLDGQSNVEETQTITLNFCNGQELAIVWVAGNYDSECSYTITDINGDVVAQDNMELAIPYTMNCTVTDCRKPTDLTASEIGNHSVKLSWTENGPATAWVVSYTTDGENFTEVNAPTNPFTLTGLTPETMYGVIVTPVCEVDKPSDMVVFTTDVPCPKPSDLSVTPYPFTADVTWNGFAEAYDIEWAQPIESTSSAWLKYDNGTLVSNVGSSATSTKTWGVMYPADMLEGNTLTKIAFYEVDNSYYTDGTVTLNVYSGGDAAPETLIGTKTFATEGTNGMREVVIDPIEFDASQNLWITLTTNATFCMTMSAQDGGANSRWFLNGSNWVDFGTLYTAGAAYSYMIRGFIETTNYSAWNWSSESGITSPYTITGLEAETDYAVRVKAVCGGEDGESLWTWAYFTTPTACDAPVNLTAVAEATSATLNWIGYQDSYNLQYRTAVKYIPVWEDDFENGIGDEWTIVAGEGATYPSAGIWYTIDPTSGLEFPAHSGTYCASSWSWNTYEYDADNWLITPQLELQGVLKYYVTTSSVYPDRYEVLLSTTDAETTSFTVTLQAMAPAPTNGQWNEVVIDLSAYAGQRGYIAIHHVDYDMNYLLIDDFGIYTPEAAGAWIPVTVNEPTYALTGLTPETEYEWQVQGVNTSCDGGLTEWTEIQTFTTPELTTLTQTIALSSTTVNYCSFYVDITLADLQTALTDALGTGNNVSIMIKSKEQNCKLTRGRWIGQLSTLDLGKMYKITVNSDCEITLEGMPVDPAEHSVNISGQGVATWIAFPFNTSMTVTNAFAGFAVNNDLVKSKAQNASYTRGRWNGALQTLEPGQGYIYKSAANATDRVFVYPSQNKAMKSIVKPMMPQDPNCVKRTEIKTIDIQIPQAPRKSVKENLIDRFKKLNNK